jgi:hypothetical protein
MRDIKWNKGDRGREKGQKEHKQGTNVKIKETASSRIKRIEIIVRAAQRIDTTEKDLESHV